MNLWTYEHGTPIRPTTIHLSMVSVEWIYEKKTMVRVCIAFGG